MAILVGELGRGVAPLVGEFGRCLLVIGKLRRTVVVALHGVWPVVLMRAGGEVIDCEGCHEASCQCEVLQPLVFPHQQRGEHKVVEQEKYEEEGELLPYHKHLVPLEGFRAVAGSADGEAQYGRCEE